MDELKTKISNTTFDTLINCDFKTLSSIISCDRRRLTILTKLDLKTIEEVQRHVAQLILKNNQISTCHNQLSKSIYLNSGCKRIDRLINGGIPVNNGIVEIVGSSGVGKTQLCLQLAIMVQLSDNYGGLNKSCIYLYDNTFPSRRFQQLSENFQKKFDSFEGRFEDNVFLKNITDYDQLKYCLLNQLPKLLQHKQFGLLIIDSIAGLFRYSDLQTNYFVRSQQFVEIVKKLHEFSKKYQLLVITVNQMMDNPNNGNSEPCLGISWSSLITHRFVINRVSLLSQIREFSIVFAPDLPNQSCQFQITEYGIE